MKMKLVKRIAIMASACIGLIGVVVLLLEIFGVECTSLLNRMAFQDSRVRIAGLLSALILVGALCAVHVYAFMIAFKGEKAYKARLITLKGDKDDAVLIRQETLDELVRNVVGEPDGVSDIAVNTRYQDMKLAVMVEMNVDLSTDIKETTTQMQEDVRHQLEEVNGIDLSGVSILVAKINVPKLADGMSMPWASKSEDALEKNAEAPETEKPAEEIQEPAQDEAQDDPFAETEEAYVPAESKMDGKNLFAPISLDDDGEKEEAKDK